MQSDTHNMAVHTQNPCTVRSMPIPNNYGDTFAAPGSHVHQGDRYEGNTFLQYIGDSAAPLPSQELLQAFARSHAGLVENFEHRMHALKTSIDRDNEAKSQALQGITNDIDDLAGRMNQNKRQLQSATHDTSATEAQVQILTAMYKALNEALDALHKSLMAHANEAERLENEKLLMNIDKSRRDVTDALSTASDITQIATAIPGNNDASRKLGDVAGKFGIVNRMIGRARNLYSSEKDERESQHFVIQTAVLMPTLSISEVQK